MVSMTMHHHSDSRRVGSELDIDVELDQEKMSTTKNSDMIQARTNKYRRRGQRGHR